MYREAIDASDMLSISILAPLSQLLGYAAELRKRTNHQGTVTMTYSHFAIVVGHAIARWLFGVAAAIDDPHKDATPIEILRTLLDGEQ